LVKVRNIIFISIKFLKNKLWDLVPPNKTICDKIRYQRKLGASILF